MTHADPFSVCLWPDCGEAASRFCGKHEVLVPPEIRDALDKAIRSAQLPAWNRAVEDFRAFVGKQP